MKIFFIICILFLLPRSLFATEKLRIFTWEWYVLEEEVKEVNQLLKQQNYDIEVEVIKPWAEGPEQMFDVIRGDKCDISFLTVNYIGMQKARTAKLLQPINTSSPRLSNYKHLRAELTNLEMGLQDKKPLYIPFGGGAYGLWADRNKVKESELPSSYSDLLSPKWHKKLSLTKTQVQPNVAIALMSLGKSPFYLNDLVKNGKMEEANELAKPNGELQKRVNALYAQVATFWDGAPFYINIIEASYGVEIIRENSKGAKWGLIHFKEPNTVWMDTINFHKSLSGKKLEAAEIFANYFIGKKVQTRVVEGLSMVSVSRLVDKNPLLDENPKFFDANLFWPPYEQDADNLILRLSNIAMKAISK
ncbi:MAG: extracellular solute-binding protein [Oligoflexia bacterium]|nr:extracellular solute-binding protein [Oligoflexia bacterium]